MSETLKKTRKAYEGLAETYDKANESIEPILAHAHAFMDLLEGSIVLDVGCGHGRDSLFFRVNGLTTVGFDLSPALISIAKSKSPNSSFVIADMRYPPIRDESIHGLWACASFHHLERKDAQGSMTRLNHSLKTGGALYFSVKNGDFTGYEDSNRYHGDPRFYTYYTVEEATKLLNINGFTVTQHQKQRQEKLSRDWTNIHALKN